jgi:hypothetical protein
MSDETYYTVLNVKETASPSEIKTAYRDLIKQVHPDTITNLAPYLRRIAEDKAKEITEAYTVLSSSGKRREYDSQLAGYRRQTAPQTPPPTPSPAQQAASQTPSGPYCNRCGTSLYASGFCPKCNKFAVATATPPQPKAGRVLGYNWAPLLRWSREHPMLAISIPIVLVWVIAALAGGDTSPQANTSCLPSQKVEVNGNFVCPSPVPVSQASGATQVPTAPAIVSPAPAQSKPIVSVSGTYLGTVHNQTANLSSSFAAILHQTKGGMLEGCMEVKPPLYGSGALHGSINGSHADFVVADITFRGDASKNTIAGSYVVSRQDGQQLGDFRLEKRKEGDPQYYCNDAVLTEVQKEVTSPDVIVVPPERLPSAKSTVIYATVISDYAAIEKRCAFLPSDNYGRCHYEPETIARPRKSDRLVILSPLTRAEDGEDIYRVRTAQGWEGWINSRFVEVQ